jgi:ABC-type multidrug transport system ATPase subunit
MEIVLDGLTKRFGSQRALDDVSLTISAGQIVAVLGPNGAGKTTFLRCLSAIMAPDSGRIFYDGEVFNRGRVDLRRRLNFLPEFPLVFPQHSVARNIGMILALYGIENGDAAAGVSEHLYELDLLAAIDTPIGHLSRGQIYKMGLAVLLSVDPELWLFDEPFASGMDPTGIAYFKRQARLATERGRTVIYSTQILDLAEKFSDRVCLIYRGKARVFDAVSNLRVHAGSNDSVLEEVFRKLKEDQL